MSVDLEKLATQLKRGDGVTTTLGREFIVGMVHPDEERPDEWWIEPEGADEYDWWIPLTKIVAVNGVSIVTLHE